MPCTLHPERRQYSMQAALQFEWAWQHPHKSRHLRDSNGFALFDSRRPKHLQANVQYVYPSSNIQAASQNPICRLVYQMISTHPYSTWPLHVKLFSDEAVAAWKAAARHSAPMPPGFTYSIELEGVDGKSGKVGSGRREPISVKDGTYRIPRSIPPNPKQSSPQNNSPLPISQKTLPYSPVTAHCNVQYAMINSQTTRPMPSLQRSAPAPLAPQPLTSHAYPVPFSPPTLHPQLSSLEAENVPPATPTLSGAT
ncbi:hypothetical protein E4T56_gene9380 [Termitomyces sp. T112]|nr:hypothetical protein E4T56_gene9380 [Termitomyces sp. T112]